jgi:hypothetical protein
LASYTGSIQFSADPVDYNDDIEMQTSVSAVPAMSRGPEYTALRSASTDINTAGNRERIADSHPGIIGLEKMNSFSIMQHLIMNEIYEEQGNVGGAGVSIKK